ncbi:hypothetical protein TNCV_4102111 [Trichonephila clavipes]|nr:hypothetical protein TNCV_4102111 [Trichonephila clavipes]
MGMSYEVYPETKFRLACVISWHKFFYAFFIEGCRLCLQPVGNIFFQLFVIVEVFTGKERLGMKEKMKIARSEVRAVRRMTKHVPAKSS